MQCFGGAWAKPAEEIVEPEVDCVALDMDRVVVCTLVVCDCAGARGRVPRGVALLF
jgi:hypothetical protein